MPMPAGILMEKGDRLAEPYHSKLNLGGHFAKLSAGLSDASSLQVACGSFIPTFVGEAFRYYPCRISLLFIF
jgi:hypothetical protein